jgi:hypothetical protein
MAQNAREQIKMAAKCQSAFTFEADGKNQAVIRICHWFCPHTNNGFAKN